MIVYAIVSEEQELMDSIPALFLDEAEAEAYAEELSNEENETYVVVSAEVQEPMSRWTDCP